MVAATMEIIWWLYNYKLFEIYQNLPGASVNLYILFFSEAKVF